MRFIPIAPLVSAASLVLAGCAVEVVGTGIAGDKQATLRASNIEAVIDANGRCEADVSIDPAALRSGGATGLVGRTECEVVAVKGRPSEVVIRDRAPTRMTTMLYNDPQGPAEYVFENNRLTLVTRHTR